MQKLLILSVTGLMLICGGYIPGMSVSAQNTTSSSTQNSRRISGVVTDTQGEPIIGATVLVKGTGIGTATDIDGKFSLDIPSNGKTLVVSFIGFDAQEIPVTNNATYKIQLSGTDYALDEVVVTALGMKREKKALGYSVQDVKGDALIENRTANIATSLNGKIAGMNISSTSIPGGSNRIVIRGNNSISGNNMPLVVVDGVPFDNSQGVDDVNTNSWGAGYSDTGDGLSMLNPDDVESISVLKGPSATALYGSRGGNGVILVTTKQGQGGRTKVSYNSNFTFENVMIQQQNEEGGWSWFKGFPASRAITLSILKGMSQLVQLNAIQYGQAEKEMQMKALKFLDKSMQTDYENLLKYDKKWQNAWPSPEQVEFLFVRSSYRDIPELGDAREVIRFYTNQAEKHWNQYSLISKGEIALLMHRNGKKEVATAILTGLKKTATISEEKGMYWANNRRGSDYFTSPIDTHCLLMSVFNEIAPDTQNTNRMKQWLLNQKRTQNWESVPATVNAIYALLLTGSDWLNTQNTCVATWDGKTYSTAEGEIATGYLKTILPNEPVNSSANPVLSIRKEGNTPAWGAVYEQYFQEIDKVKGQKGVLSVEKKLFVETNNGTNRQIRPVTPEQPLRIGDKVIVRLTIRTDREMNYVFLKDLRAGCFEPADQLSSPESRDGIWYYRSPKDVSENFFINRLPEGTFVLEYPVYVSRSGEYAGGISTIQCMYAPEFVSHTAGESLRIMP